MILLAFSVTVLVSCDGETKQNDEPTVVATNLTPPEACYTYSKDSNNVSMRITVKENIVTGSLEYAWYQKDKNKGTIQGEMKGDTLFADYSFMSEGVNSVRQVAFLKNDGGWIEGYGEIEDQSGKTVFKNKSALKFDYNVTLKRSDCK